MHANEIKSGKVNDWQGTNPAALITRQIAELTFLPPAFEIVPRLLLLLDDPETNSDALAELVHVDPGLTADVLHVANSSYFSRGSRTETLIEAINRIGLREIYLIAMKIIASPVLAGAEHAGGEQVDLWKHSLTTSVAAQVLSTRSGTEDSEVAFTAGLLHDLGKVLIGHALGNAYKGFIETCKSENRALYQSEQQVLKMTHAEAGGKLLRRWSFPDKIIAAVEMHHEPTKAPRAHAPLAALIYAANIMAHRVSSAELLPDYVVEPDVDCLKLAGLTPVMLKEHEEEVRQNLDREQRRFRS